MKMRILALMLAAVMLLGGTAALAEDAAPSPSDAATGTPTETISGDSTAPAPTDGDTAAPTETITIAPDSRATVNYGEHNAWFDAELAEANTLGLIPSRFEGADLRVPMSRAEFAAVALLVYQRMSGRAVDAPNNNPFTDTTDSDVLRAYTAGIVNGYGEGIYAPHAQVSRQQTAAMLTRVYKATNWEGWTLAGDDTYSERRLDYGEVALYADDSMIDSYAFASVYFLTKYGVSNGVGNNCFAPDDGCTREEGIVLALRLFNVFG